MTRDDVLSIPAGPTLDHLIADRVVGWTNIRDSDGYGHWVGDAPPGYEDIHYRASHCEGEIPCYSTDIAAVWQVVGAIRQRWWQCNPVKLSMTLQGWCCRIKFTLLGQDHCAVADGDTAPLAICRAALLAVLEAK